MSGHERITLTVPSALKVEMDQYLNDRNWSKMVSDMFRSAVDAAKRDHLAEAISSLSDEERDRLLAQLAGSKSV